MGRLIRKKTIVACKSGGVRCSCRFSALCSTIPQLGIPFSFLLAVFVLLVRVRSEHSELTEEDIFDSCGD